MPRLRNRQQQIPGGFRFGLPEANWKAAPFSSFDSIVNNVDRIVKANPQMAQRNGWPMNRADIENWVDEFNATICANNNWSNYITEGGDAWVPPPKLMPLSSVRNAAAGAKTIAAWIGGGAVPVTREQAEKRALVCSKCPLNEQGYLSNFFVRATSELIRMQIQTAQDLDLTTPHDSKLGVCKACSCPMRLKVWTPIKTILDHIPAESRAALAENCWVVAEGLTEEFVNNSLQK